VRARQGLGLFHRAAANSRVLMLMLVIVIAGHKTSVSLEDAFWEGLKEIAGERHTFLSDLVAAIDSERQHGNLSSAIRLWGRLGRQQGLYRHESEDRFFLQHLQRQF
jgi:predicted DNA-binding ribbon-helix-helix protein